MVDARSYFHLSRRGNYHRSIGNLAESVENSAESVGNQKKLIKNPEKSARNQKDERRKTPISDEIGLNIESVISIPRGHSYVP